MHDCTGATFHLTRGKLRGESDLFEAEETEQRDRVSKVNSTFLHVFIYYKAIIYIVKMFKELKVVLKNKGGIENS